MAKIMGDAIQFVGLNELRLDEQERVRELSEQYFPKIKRELNNLTQIIVHIKCHDEAGSNRKYSLHVKVVAPGKIIESNKHHGFGLSDVLHATFDGLISEIHHAYHSDRSRPSRK